MEDFFEAMRAVDSSPQYPEPGFAIPPPYFEIRFALSVLVAFSSLERCHVIDGVNASRLRDSLVTVPRFFSMPASQDTVKCATCEKYFKPRGISSHQVACRAKAEEIQKDSAYAANLKERKRAAIYLNHYILRLIICM
jgi:hypothetical protein